MATETKSISIVSTAFTLIAGPGLVSIHAQADDQVQICIAAALPAPGEDDVVNLKEGWSTITVVTNNAYARATGPNAVLLPVIRG